MHDIRNIPEQTFQFCDRSSQQDLGDPDPKNSIREIILSRLSVIGHHICERWLSIMTFFE